MYDLVNDIEAYPQFLPWCSDSRIVSRDDSIVVAEVEMNKGGMRRRFATRNQLTPPDRINVALVDGPFRELNGDWRFVALREAGCEVRLNMQFEFAGMLVDMALGPFFEQTCRSLIDAFVGRARQIYPAAVTPSRE